METKRTIAFVIPSLACGGAERQFVTLARYLKRAGWTPLFFVLSRRDMYEPFMRELELDQVSIEVCQMYPGLRAIPTGLRVGLRLRARRPAIVQGVLLYGNLVARLSRLVYWSQVNVSAARNVREGPLWQERCYSFTDWLTDLTVQNSAAGAARFVARRYVSPKKVRVIPNGVELERFSIEPGAAKRLRNELVRNGEFLWIAVGRLVPNKNFPALVQAFQLVQQRHPRAILAIAGTGPEKAKIEQIVSQYAVSDRVLLLGPRNDVPELLAAADALVMASIWEGFPNVLLEAAASGLPVVATDVGANREVVKDGTTGFLVPPGAVETLADRMLALMDMPLDERRALGRAAQRLVATEFAFPKVAQQWATLYEEFLRNAGASI